MNAKHEQQELVQLLKEAIVIINNGEMKKENAYKVAGIKLGLVEASLITEHFFD
jgi:hypothetical protein